MKHGTTTFYTSRVLIKVAEASDRALEAVALKIEGETKKNIQSNGQIDTGFMVNSVYTMTKSGDTFDQTRPSGTYTNRAGKAIKRTIAPSPTLPDNARAAVVVGAEYAVWQEELQPFLYPAAETVASQVKGTVEKIIRDELHD